jgi:hypothetical protein
VSGDSGVTITLTDGQLEQVIDDASRRSSLAGVLPEVSGFDELRSVLLSLKDDVRCSRSTLCALLVLAAFSPDGTERELTDVARQLGLSPSATHRYISTWLAVGLLERAPRSRRYRRRLVDHASVRGAAVGGGDAG